MQHQSQVVQRASESWIPNIREDIDKSQTMAEDVSSKLPYLENRLDVQMQVYHRRKQQVNQKYLRLQRHRPSYHVVSPR